VQGLTLRDADVSAGVFYWYYVTSARDMRLPGDPLPAYIESRASNVSSAKVNCVTLEMPDAWARAGTDAVMHVSVDNATGISGEGLSIRIEYDPSVLTPASQVSGQAAVERTALTREMTISDNGLTAQGTLTIDGVSGVAVGEGHMFDLHFHVGTEVPNGTVVTNRMTAVVLRNAEGSPLMVDASDTAVLTVNDAYFLGDIIGDGALSMDDHQLLMMLLRKDSRGPTPQELYSGDINGDGELTNADIPLLLRVIHGKAVNP
jgi:hypothetical protein